MIEIIIPLNDVHEVDIAACRVLTNFSSRKQLKANIKI